MLRLGGLHRGLHPLEDGLVRVVFCVLAVLLCPGLRAELCPFYGTRQPW